jgi:hypothetical protein
MNLFSAALDKIRFADVEAFLGFALPEEQRLKEGETIDYKDGIPDELGDWVAAFANVSGGLIFIGIKSDKKKQNVPVAWLGIPATADLETRISAKILSTVRPKADFKIGSVPLPNGNVIAIVRVTEGVYPPYEYQQGNTTKITLRVHDARKSANVREIEALFKKRNDSPAMSEQAILQYVNANGFDCTNANGIQDLEFHRIVIVPRRRTLVRLDAGNETQFADKIQRHFGSENDLAVSDRRGDYLQLQSKRTVSPYWHRLWRIWRDGVIGFTGSLSGQFPTGKPIGDLAHNLLSTCQLASEIFAENEVRGEVNVGQLIRSSTTNLLREFPEYSPMGTYYETSAITIPQWKGNSIDRTFSYSALDISDLYEPYEHIAEILMYNLRELRKITVDYQGFLQCIQQLRVQAT